MMVLVSIIGANIKHYLQLLRLSHWAKNILIFIPLFFSAKFYDASAVAVTIFGFVCFSFLSSIVYILNDIRDIEQDRLHSTKCRRPLASGKIQRPQAVTALVILSAVLIILLAVRGIYGELPNNPGSIGLLLLYLLLNVGYSCGLKNIPIVDVTILASGYVIRVLFGAFIIAVDVSVWLYLVITLGAFYLGLGKRKNELAGNENKVRAVMRFYSHNFLDKNMYVCQALCITFYALWSIDAATVERFHTSAFIYTIPLILIIFLKYSLNIETENDGDPVTLILHDKILLALFAAYIICAFCIICFNRVV